jgi:hypothetical protein
MGFRCQKIKGSLRGRTKKTKGIGAGNDRLCLEGFQGPCGAHLLRENPLQVILDIEHQPGVPPPLIGYELEHPGKDKPTTTQRLRPPDPPGCSSPPFEEDPPLTAEGKEERYPYPHHRLSPKRRRGKKGGKEEKESERENRGWGGSHPVPKGEEREKRRRDKRPWNKLFRVKNPGRRLTTSTT